MHGEKVRAMFEKLIFVLDNNSLAAHRWQILLAYYIGVYNNASSLFKFIKLQLH